MSEPSASTDVERESAGAGIALRVVFLIALAFTGLGLLECAFIVYDIYSGGRISAGRAPDLSFGVRSWTVHHALRPGWNTPNVHTSSMGLRSPEFAIPKPAGTIRVLLLGDSFTFGLRVLDNQVFARRLEERLRARFAPAPVEVVNAGVLSYCPLLEYIQYRNQLGLVEPDLVVLNFDMSDVQDHLAYSRDAKLSPDGVPLYVTEPSLAEQRSSRMPQLLVFDFFWRRVQGLRGRVQSTLEGVPFQNDADRYLWALDGGGEMASEAQAAMQPLVHLKRLLTHQQIPFALATYPQPWQVSADATPLPPIRGQYGIGYNKVHLNDRAFAKLAKFAQDQQLPFVNATDRFRADQQPASLFLQDDFHFSPKGNELYASVLFDFIVEQGFIQK